MNTRNGHNIPTHSNTLWRICILVHTYPAHANRSAQKLCPPCVDVAASPMAPLCHILLGVAEETANICVSEQVNKMTQRRRGTWEMISQARVCARFSISVNTDSLCKRVSRLAMVHSVRFQVMRQSEQFFCSCVLITSEYEKQKR